MGLLSKPQEVLQVFNIASGDEWRLSRVTDLKEDDTVQTLRRSGHKDVLFVVPLVLASLVTLGIGYGQSPTQSATELEMRRDIDRIVVSRTPREAAALY